MPLGGAVALGVGSLASGAVGGITAANAQSAATAAREKALQQWLAVNVPDPAQQAVELQRYRVSGTLSPQLETAFQQSQTGLKNLQIDPSSRAAELSALDKMSDLATHGGMDAQAQQAEAQALNTSNANERGQRGAIVQNFAARGMGGSGAQLAAELQASQGDANTAAAAGMSSAASAESRALEAMTRSGSMGATLNSQDYNQAAKAAEAQDAINRFNTQAQQNTSNTNVSAQNNAQAANLANQQAVDNSNVGVGNQQELHNKDLIQQQFQNEEGKATGAANAENGVATQANTNAQTDANMWGGISAQLAQGAGAVGQYAAKQSTKAAADPYGNATPTASTPLNNEDGSQMTTANNEDLDKYGQYQV